MEVSWNRGAPNHPFHFRIFHEINNPAIGNWGTPILGNINLMAHLLGSWWFKHHLPLPFITIYIIYHHDRITMIYLSKMVMFLDQSRDPNLVLRRQNKLRNISLNLTPRHRKKYPLKRTRLTRWMDLRYHLKQLIETFYKPYWFIFCSTVLHHHWWI